MPNSKTHLGIERHGSKWRDLAVCRPGNGHDPALWFPPPPRPYGTRKEQRTARRHALEREREAKRLCGLCTVRQECLDYANDNDEREGIWAGMTPQERGKQPLR